TSPEQLARAISQTNRLRLRPASSKVLVVLRCICVVSSCADVSIWVNVRRLDATSSYGRTCPMRSRVGPIVPERTRLGRPSEKVVMLRKGRLRHRLGRLRHESLRSRVPRKRLPGESGSRNRSHTYRHVSTTGNSRGDQVFVLQE